MRSQLLDPLNIKHGVLCYDVGFEAGLPNPYLATELCRAANDWSMDHWLDGRDERLHGAILVASEQPDEAAKEIRRVAAHPRMVEVLLVANMLGKPFGHPVYRPIHEAAVECGLPIAIHLGGEIFPSSGRYAAGGPALSRLELFTGYPQGGMHHASSLITHAVFHRYPDLRVLIKEYGFSWLPWLLWRLDAQFETLRWENPAVSELPSRTFLDHVIVSTQPFDHTDDSRQMIDLLESFEGIEDILVFATDYPHWDADEPSSVAARLPKAWHKKIFHDNAARFFSFDDGIAETSHPRANREAEHADAS
jgi:predicted TIM-barrel fold metal-dependent hydrolase